MTAMGAAFPTHNNSHSHVVTAPAVSHSVEYRSLADGDAGTFQTLDAMKAAVHGRVGPDYSGYQDEFNIRAANSICARGTSPGHDVRRQIAALFDWVCRNIQYQEHPINQQTLQDARRTLELRKGDCVSLSVLLATLLACLGYKSQFVAQWVDGESASHVYVEVLLPDGNIALDAVACDQPMGWRQPLLDGGYEVPWPIFT